MAQVMGLALDLDLQVVAQVHTHPVDAFHSDGDEDGANIRYPGFYSIVLPDYGARLPSFARSAVYLCDERGDWVALPESCIETIPSGSAL
jgi:proteasome lid subunit RPN8/RPN11